MTGAQLLVKCLEAQEVEFVFGIPGAKVDGVFNALLDSKIRLILCRHEQNAAFMAAAYGRLTGKPGVVLVTSGPGVANLATGLLTATTEGDPIVALGGNVARAMQLRSSHQNTHNAKLMEAVTKSSVEIAAVDAIPETIENAFRIATQFRRGACFVSLPQDVLSEITALQALPVLPAYVYPEVAAVRIQTIAQKIKQAQLPVILLGEEASYSDNTAAVRALLQHTALPVISTYQAAGVVSRELQHCFVGRVGLFKNQPGDVLLEKADLVITVGFNAVEYDPELWHAKGNKAIVHIDYKPADIRGLYRPQYELIGDIAKTLTALQQQLPAQQRFTQIDEVKKLHQALYDKIESGQHLTGSRVHPLRFIYELRRAIDDQTMIMCDVGSVYMWMARYFLSYQPHHLLFSNGQQTLGVALPWAMAARLAYPNKSIISLSGDGGFLFSAMELETAVREKLKIIHFIWTDGTYNMVLEQEVMKYKRKSGVDLGKLNIVDFASAFGAKGLVLNNPDQFSEVFKQAQAYPGPVLIDVPIDYSHNPELFVAVNPHAGN